MAAIVNRLARLAFPLSVVGTAVGVSILVKDHYRGEQVTSNARIDGKTVIITGANSGIGKETARVLAQRGGHVILACRDMKKGLAAAKEITEETKNANIKVLHLDLSSLESVRNFVSRFKKEEKNLDILINNAGIMRCPRWKTIDGFEMQFGVNHLGHFLLTNLLLDVLKESSPSRVITVSSTAHVKGEIQFDDINADKRYNSSEAYSDSKLANILFTHELAKKLKGTGVTANVVNPGIVKTQIGRHTKMQQSAFSMSILGPLFWLFVRTPEQGAQSSIYCAISEDLQNVSGKYFYNCKETECDAKGKDDAVAKKLWDVSAEMVSLVETDTNKTDKDASSKS